MRRDQWSIPRWIQQAAWLAFQAESLWRRAQSWFRLVIKEVLYQSILQEVRDVSVFSLKQEYGLAPVHFLAAHDLLLLLCQDAAVLIEEAPKSIHQELADKLEEDVFIVAEVFWKHLFQDPSDHRHLVGVIPELVFSIAQDQVYMHLKSGNQQRRCHIWLQVSLGVSITQG